MNQLPEVVVNLVDGTTSLGTEDFRHLAETLPQIVWTSSPDGTVDYLSPQMSHFSGIPLDDPDYLDWSRVVHPDDLDELVERWNHSVKTGEIYSLEFRLRAADGEYFWFAGRAVPVFDTAGEILKWYGTTTNIDVMKKAEFALKQSAVEKDKFIAMLGHELRNPLAALSNSYQNLIHKKLAHEDRYTVLSALGRQIHYLKRLVDDVLDVSRLISGKMRMISTKLEINQLVAASAEDIRHLCEDSEISISTDLTDVPVWVEGDSVRLSQCFGNLLSNAVKFTKPGGHIKIMCRNNEDTSSADVSVIDDGVGMTAKELATIFEPFSQGRSAGRLSREGLGLGLAITQEIIELHDGVIAVTSEGKGKGSTFTISIPLCAEPQKKIALSDDNGIESESINILLVDDDESVASTLRLFLEMEGHQVTVASCGRTAFAVLDKGLPDLIFCDLTLPGSVKGWDIARRVKSNYPEDQMPYMVALSGHTGDEYVEKSLDAGFNEHVAKPPTPEKLRNALKNASSL